MWRARWKISEARVQSCQSCAFALHSARCSAMAALQCPCKRDEWVQFFVACPCKKYGAQKHLQYELYNGSEPLIIGNGMRRVCQGHLVCTGIRPPSAILDNGA